MIQLNNFVVVNQNYYMNPQIDDSIGMNKTVFVEVSQEGVKFDDAINECKDKLKSLGFDLEEKTIMDFASDWEVLVWDFYDYTDIFGIMRDYNKDYSLILLDGTIKNF